MQQSRIRLVVPFVLLASAGLIGCGSDEDLPARATPNYLGDVALEYLDDALGDYKLTEYRSSGLDPKAVGAEFRFNIVPTSDGDSIRLIVGPANPEGQCDPSKECIVEKDDLGTTTIEWAEYTPEEDAGFVSVSRFTPDGEGRLSYQGPEIKGDPRKQDLPISVQTLVKIVEDPRFALTPE